MNTKDLAEQNLIYKVRCGSHAYGTNLPTSDVDYAGIFIPPLQYYFGLQAFDLLSEQADEDKAYYSLRKFATLAVANNPNVLELLFVDNADVVLSTPASEALRANKKLFLSQRCQKTFVGYAHAQLHRIRTHIKWLSQELEAMKVLIPVLLQGRLRSDWVAWRFGDNMVRRIDDYLYRSPLNLSQEAISVVSRAWVTSSDHRTKKELDTLLPFLGDSGIVCPEKTDSKFFEEIDMEKTDPALVFRKHLYDEAKKRRDQYVTWMAERNPQRHETELQFGYDTKHAMHLVRLLRAGYEILTTGDFHVRRPDAAELLDIRAGKWTYEQITRYADEMMGKINSLGTESGQQFSVPVMPDINKINLLVVQITKEHFAEGKQCHTL